MAGEAAARAPGSRSTERGSTGMTTSDALRYLRIPLSHGSGAMPAVGFGTLIPDLVATNEAAKTSLGVGFRHLEAGILQRDDLFSRRNYGIRIIAQSGSDPRSTPAAGGFKSITPIVIRSTLPAPFIPATTNSRETTAAR